jgi:hypothetical protein
MTEYACVGSSFSLPPSFDCTFKLGIELLRRLKITECSLKFAKRFVGLSPPAVGHSVGSEFELSGEVVNRFLVFAHREIECPG